jgi:hypothetical protein
MRHATRREWAGRAVFLIKSPMTGRANGASDLFDLRRKSTIM